MAIGKHHLGVNVGDIYAARLRDGRFGAVQVVRRMKDGMRQGGDSATVVCTSYLGQHPPELTDPALRQPLRQTRFRYEGELAITIVDDAPPAHFVHIGMLPSIATGSEIECPSYGQGWNLVESVLLEWRWIHDRAALDLEVEGTRMPIHAFTPPTSRTRTPNSALTEPDFWNLIDCLDMQARDGDETIEPLVAALLKRSRADIVEFAEILAQKLYFLDGETFANHAGDAGGSSDLFLYARCWVVAQGKEFYERVRSDARTFPRDVDLEPLLSAAPEAHFRRTGEELETDTHYSFETGANAQGWDKLPDVR